VTEVLHQEYVMVRNAGKRVLIVDSDRAVADSLAMIFLGEGYEVRQVYTSEAALPLVQRWNPDLAIVEIILADMNGLDCAIRIQATCPKCGIVLFSGQCADYLKDAARERGYAFFDKPVHPLRLLGEAERLLNSSSSG
jgi:DNA-binding NtrC family response regulator